MSIVRKGTYPVLKYTARVWGFHTIFIDDNYGNLVIASDQGAFRHWWGLEGRVDKKLREFLVRTSPGYIQDKLSYGLSRWDQDYAEKGVIEMCEQKWGKDTEEWPIEVAEAVEAFDFGSWESMYHCLFAIHEFSQAFEPPDLPGESYANPGVRRFVENVWPSLVEFWKAELASER